MTDNPFVDEQALSKNKVIYLCEIIGGGLYALALIGIPFLVFGIKRYRRAKECQQYAGILLADSSRRISSIASSTGEPYAQVVANLRELSARGLLRDCVIDAAEDTVSFPGDVAVGNEPPRNSGKLVPIVCPNCNGSNKLPAGMVGECEYCGTPLEAPAPTVSVPVQLQGDEPSEPKKKSLADVSLGEIAGAGVALLGVVKSIKK